MKSKRQSKGKTIRPTFFVFCEGESEEASNPCLELWYLLHFVDQKAEITSSQCLSVLKKHLPKYKKGEVCSALQAVLSSKQDVAVARANLLQSRANPSSDVLTFLADIKKASK